jgi:hypothetical protein
MDWLDKIISLYLFVCSESRNELSVYCQRFANYAALSFSDEEVATIYMFGIMEGLKDKKILCIPIRFYYTLPAGVKSIYLDPLIFFNNSKKLFLDCKS